MGAHTAARQVTPHAAEIAAAQYLAAQGCRIVARNVACRGGEIDLIVLDRGTLAFVEVRQRSHAGYGGAAASITTAKQARIRRAARYWLAGPGRPHARRPCRFDAVLYEPRNPGAADWQTGIFGADR